MKPILFFVIILIVLPSTVIAEDLKYFPGTTYYNDPFEFQVNPGDTIYLGRIYDLRNVMGTNHTIALWNDWRMGGSNCNPDKLFTVGYIETNGQINPKAVYLDPSKGWKAGDYYAWSGCFYKYDFKTGEKIQKTYSHENNFMFTVINPPPRVKNMTPQSEVINGTENKTRGKLPVPEITKSVRGGPIQTTQTKTISRIRIDEPEEIIVISSNATQTAPEKEIPFWQNIPWYYLVIAIIIIAVVIIIFIL
jgi:hypothetical protein